MSGIENLPEIAIGAGIAAGAVADTVAMVRTAHERRAWIQQGEALASPGFLKKAGRVLTSSLIVTVPPVAYINGLAWSQQDTVTTTLPTIELVVDHSRGAGETEVGGKPAIVAIDAIADEMARTGKVSLALVASSNQVKPVPVEKVSQQEPFGAAPISDAVDQAITGVVDVRTDALNNGTQASVGIVVLTNGNALGDNAGVVIQRAKDVGTAVTVINVESGVQEPQVQQALQQIAKDTGGSYMNIDAAQGETVAKNVVDQLSSEQAPPKKGDDQKKMKIIGAIFAATTLPIVYRNRRRESVVNGYSKRGKK